MIYRTWPIDSSTGHIDRLRVFTRDSKIDILAITESKFTEIIQLTTMKSIYRVLKLFGETDKFTVKKVVGFAFTNMYEVTFCDVLEM